MMWHINLSSLSSYIIIHKSMRENIILFAGSWLRLSILTERILFSPQTLSAGKF